MFKRNYNVPIDDVYKKLLATLTDQQRIEEVSEELLNLPNSYKKVFYVVSLLQENDNYPLIMREPKQNTTLKKYTELAHSHFDEGNLHKALEYSNLALMNSPITTPLYKSALHTRAYILASMKAYESSLRDIEMIIALAKPGYMGPEVNAIREYCEKSLEALGKPHHPPFRTVLEDNTFEKKLIFKPYKHEKYVDASSKVEVVFTPEMGRQVVATEYIDVGEAIVQEDPFVTVLRKSEIHMACSHCLVRKFNLYPCMYCVVAMYCSRRCVELAWYEYHRYECPLGASLLAANFTQHERLALRATIRARCQFDNWDMFINDSIKANKPNDTDNWGCKLISNKLVYTSKQYASIHALATNVEKRDISDIFKRCVTAAVFMDYLSGVHFFDSPDNPKLVKTIVIFVADTLIRHLMTGSTNMHSIFTNVANADGNDTNRLDVGTGAYPFLSLINHSCEPNVIRFYKRGRPKATLIAIRPIKKGAQLFYNYEYDEIIRDTEQMSSRLVTEIKPSEKFPSANAAAAPSTSNSKIINYAVHFKEDRHAILWSQYKFYCSCKACDEDWPLAQNLNSAPDLPPDIVDMITRYLNEDVVKALRRGDKQIAQKIFKPLCKLATDLECYIPCKEATDCQEVLIQSLVIMAGVLPHAFSNHNEMQIPGPVTVSFDSAKFYVAVRISDITAHINILY